MTVATATIPARPDGAHHPFDWRQAAACAGVDPNLFHGTIDQLHQARHVCARCEVAEVCRWTAMAAEDPALRSGVWGALLPGQRDRLAEIYGPGQLLELLGVELAWWAGHRGGGPA